VGETMPEQEQGRWSERLLDAIPEGIVLLDDARRITMFSRGAERITGWSHAEAQGRTSHEVLGLPPAEPEALLLSGGGSRRLLVRLRDGRQVMLALTAARLEGVGGEGAPDEAARSEATVLVIRDVTEEEVMHRMVGNFLANVAHEFRTPLTALGASVQLLMDQSADLSPAEVRELMGSLQLGVWRLQILVDNLLEGASIEAGQFRVYARPCNVREVIAEALFTLQPLLERRSQRYVLHIPEELPSVRADARRTVQVLVNLLNNASKYGRRGGLITVGVELVGTEQMRISVTDQGRGIPESLRPGLFRPFQRGGHNGENSRAGVGLGLSVVKAIVEAQGGSVDVGKGPEGGACVGFTLPVLAPVTAEDGPVAEP
jgi:PAS domain S-box-containing protein